MSNQMVMQHVKSTKGTHVYHAVNEDTAAVKTVYIKKSALGNTVPAAITLIVEVKS